MIKLQKYLIMSQAEGKGHTTLLYFSNSVAKLEFFGKP